MFLAPVDLCLSHSCETISSYVTTIIMRRAQNVAYNRLKSVKVKVSKIASYYLASITILKLTFQESDYELQEFDYGKIKMIP